MCYAVEVAVELGSVTECRYSTMGRADDAGEQCPARARVGEAVTLLVLLSYQS